MLSNRRLKSLFVEGLLPAASAKVRSCRATHTSADYHSVFRYTQALGDSSHSTRRQAASSSVHDRLNLNSRLIKPMRKDQVLSLETFVDDASTQRYDGGADRLLKLAGSTSISITASLPLNCYRDFSTHSSAFTPQQTAAGSITDRTASL